MTITVLGVNCSLRKSEHRSNTQVMMDDIVSAMRAHGDVEYDSIRIVDHNVLPGVTLDEGEGDEWPPIAKRILEADGVIFGVPIWLGHPSSIAQRVLERLDHYLFHMNERGMKPMYGKVAAVAITGNEDGGHHVYAEMFQALNDLGFTLPPESRAYWTGWADDAPRAIYPEHRDNEMAKYMVEHCGRNLYHFAHTIRDLVERLPQLDSDRAAAEEDPLSIAERAARAHR